MFGHSRDGAVSPFPLHPLPDHLARHVTAFWSNAHNLPCSSHHLNNGFSSQISQHISNTQSLLGSAGEPGVEELAAL